MGLNGITDMFSRTQKAFGHSVYPETAWVWIWSWLMWCPVDSESSWHIIVTVSVMYCNGFSLIFGAGLCGVQLIAKAPAPHTAWCFVL
jgi:hypothetical protein